MQTFPARFLAVCVNDPNRPWLAHVHVHLGIAWVSDGHRGYGYPVELADGEYDRHGAPTGQPAHASTCYVLREACDSVTMTHALNAPATIAGLQRVATWWPRLDAGWDVARGHVELVIPALPYVAKKAATRANIQPPPPARIYDVTPPVIGCDVGLTVSYALDALLWTNAESLQFSCSKSPRYQYTEPAVLVGVGPGAGHFAVVMPRRIR